MTNLKHAVHQYGTASAAKSPLLLIHGFPFDHNMWQPQIESLSRDYHVIAPDLRGFGESEIADRDGSKGVSMETYAADLVEILDGLKITEPVILCGFSMGGYIMWQFLKHYPERVKAFVACDTRAGADSAEASAGRITMAEKVIASGAQPLVEAMLPKLLAAETTDSQPELVEQVKRMMQQAAPTAIAAALRGMSVRPDVESDLISFDWPALVLCGVEDAISPLEEMRGIAEKLPQGEFCEIPDAGHMTAMENPAAVNDVLLKFVASV